MQTQKEILRDTILTQMRPFLDSVTLEMLNNVIVKALFNVDVVDMETLPATRETTNEYILELYMMKKVPKLSKQTAKYYLLTINHFIEFTGKSHLISENPVDNVEKWTEVEKPIDYLRDWEFEALRDACKRQQGEKIKDINAYREALRDRALLEFLRSTAIRVGECVSVNKSDIDWNNGEVLVYGHKTKRYRKACIDDVSKYHLKKYIDSRTDDNEALFVSLKSPHRRMQKTSIEYAIRSIADRSILGRRVYPHLLRKTTATNMAKRGCPRELIAFYLGHKDGNTKTLNKHYAATDPAQITAAFWRYGAAA